MAKATRLHQQSSVIYRKEQLLNSRPMKIQQPVWRSSPRWRAARGCWVHSCLKISLPLPIAEQRLEGFKRLITTTSVMKFPACCSAISATSIAFRHGDRTGGGGGGGSASPNTNTAWPPFTLRHIEVILLLPKTFCPGSLQYFPISIYLSKKHTMYPKTKQIPLF